MQPSLRTAILGFLRLVARLAGCVGELPPPPQLRVTSPERGMIQSTAGQVTVKGTALPGPNGSPVTQVTINKTPATVSADGSFTAVVMVPEGATLLETIAISEEGGKAIDARAVHIGELRPVGSRIDHAVRASLSTEAFVRISEAASAALKAQDFAGLLPVQTLGDSNANVKVTINKLAIGSVKVALTPVDGGLKLQVEVGALSASAKAAYGGTFVPDGSTTVSVTADKIIIAGTLVVTPTGMTGFKTTVTSPNVTTTALKLQASGIIGTILDLLNDHLASTVQSAISRAAEIALDPLVNTALGALSAPRQLSVLGKTIDLQAAASAIQFSSDGALASINVATKIAGSESSKGYIFTKNGTPELDPAHGVEVALSDDLLNDMLSQVHALGVMNLHMSEDFGLFDGIDIKPTLPPMISANTSDGSVRLVLGDMIATVTNGSDTLVRAAINAQVDVSIARGKTANEISIQLGDVHVFANLLDEPQNPSTITAEELQGAADAGVGIQLDSLDAFLITVPVPTVAGVTLDNLTMHGDQGYVVIGGLIH